MPKRILQGEVVNDSVDKTIKVLVQRRVKHPVYGKYITTSKSYLAHDPENVAKNGDVVQIQECRPVSKRKTWQIVTDKEA